MNTRAWSTLEIKAIDEEKRIIEGIASTPTTDRMEDIVESSGAEYKLPLPFLWQHDRYSPIGHVTKASVTKAGIAVTVQLVKAEPTSPLFGMLESAWESIRLKLVRGLSIGFRALESTDIEGSWGRRFTKWEWLELSAVTIPANEEATITAVKSHDTRPAAPGRPVVHLNRPGASGKNGKKSRGADMTITERIGAFEAKRQANVARMNAITEEADKDGRTKSEEEKDEFDTLMAEVKSIDAELKDLRDMEALNAAQAKPVDKTSTTKAGSESRTTTVHVEREEKLEPGIEFARYAMAVRAANGDPSRAADLMQLHYPKTVRPIAVLRAAAQRGVKSAHMIDSLMRTKDAVAAGTTSDATWASPLVAYNQFSGDFIEYLRARTIIGRFGQDGIPDLRRIPFNVHIRGQTSGGTAGWVGESKPKPVTAFDYSDVYHGYYKVAAISVITDELIRFSDPSAERLVRDGLAGAVIERIDTDFIDPDKALVANVSPASITNGVAQINSTGNAAHDMRDDLAALFGAAITAKLPMSGAVLIMGTALALRVSLMRNALGQAEFPGLGIRGGTLEGLPVIVSDYVPAEMVVLAFASEIYLSDDGVVTVDMSNQASIEMQTAPTQDGSAGTGASLVSMWQTNSTALRAERYINWSKRRASAVAVLKSVTWGVPASS